MQITFVSNYINHHQLPFCREMIALCKNDDNFTFIQTEEVEQDRVNMGWGTLIPDFVRCSYQSDEEMAACRKLIMDSDVVIFGGCEDESYIKPRLDSPDNKLTIRYSERVYKDGQWKFITPRGLIRKNKDHTAYNKKNVYLLCSGAYVASDFRLFGAYPGKMFKWGYFPEVKEYDIDSLMAGKATGNQVPTILWAGRFLDWKHPELAIEVARFLRDNNLPFTMNIIGGGPKEFDLKELIYVHRLENRVNLLGFKNPSEVRQYMEKSDIFLFTSDRHEGWGAVANEAMNSGCALVADHMIGAAPYLIKNGINACAYDDRAHEELIRWVEELVKNPELRQSIGREAYETMVSLWSPKVAAHNLMELIKTLLSDPALADDLFDYGPCSPETSKSESRIREELFGRYK